MLESFTQYDTQTKSTKTAYINHHPKTKNSKAIVWNLEYNFSLENGPKVMPKGNFLSPQKLMALGIAQCLISLQNIGL